MTEFKFEDEFEAVEYLTWARRLIGQMKQVGTITLEEADALAELDRRRLMNLTVMLLAAVVS